MAMLRKLFFRKPPDGLLEICERVYVFDCCFTTDAWSEENYKVYIDGIVGHLRENLQDASILVFNFREEDTKSVMADILSEYDITIMDYPRHYEGCPVLKMELIHHFLRSGESWLSLGQHNVLLMHCERGGWPVLAFMLAALLIFRKLYTGEQRTLDMVYKQSPRELLHLLTPLNPIPSQLRYLQYVSRRNVAIDWPPLDRALMLDCIILRFIPNFDGEGGCHPLFRIYGQDPFSGDKNPKMLYSTPKRSKNIRCYKQGESELIKIDISCHIQGDVVVESTNLNTDMEQEMMMFRVMFNTAFVRSNIMMLNRDEVDILWDGKDHFPKDFRAEILFSEMDAAAAVMVDRTSCFEEKEGLPVEAFAKVQEIFNYVDWLDPNADAALNVLQQMTASAIINDKLDTVSDQHGEMGTMPQGKMSKQSPENEKSKKGDMASKVDATPKASDISYLPGSMEASFSPETPPLRPARTRLGKTFHDSLPHTEVSHQLVIDETEAQLQDRSLSPISRFAPESQSSPTSCSKSPTDTITLASNSGTTSVQPPPALSPRTPLKEIPPVKTRLESSSPPPPPLPPTPPPKDHKPAIVRPPPPPPHPSKNDLHVIEGTPPPPSPALKEEPQIKARHPPPPPPPPPAKDDSQVRAKSPPPPPPPPCLSVKAEAPSTPSAAPPLPPPPLPPSASFPSNKPNPSAPAAPPPPSAPTAPRPPSAPAAPPPPAPFGKGGSNPSNGFPGSLSDGSGSKGRILSRTISSKNNGKKLKPLHWLKLSRAVQGSLWAETQKSGEASKAPEIDMSELESLFSAAAPSSGSTKKSNSQSSVGPKSDKVQLIEHRRAYNCEIMLSKVKVPLHELMSSVLALEESALDIDQVENIIKFCPTKEEMELLKGYTGEKEKLGRCEQFFLELMQVPRVESKLRVFSFKIQFQTQVADLRNNLNVVNAAADEIRGSVKFKRVMQTILSLGNALNQGTARGSAIGFRLDSLLKLTETRARNKKMTLMHYLCKVLADKLPEVLDFSKDVANLEPAAKIQLKILAEEMQAISKGLEKVVQELSISENDGPMSETFRKNLKGFLSHAEAEVRSLASLYSRVGRNVDTLILYFGEDPSRCPFEQVVNTLLNFTGMFNKAHEENSKQLELEMKKTADSDKKKCEQEKIIPAAIWTGNVQ
ncbi:hypothetical protein S83_002222 [Arachis hypogaea]